MNNYATIAQQNWQTLAPEALEKMSQEINLQDYFTQLGNKAEMMIQELIPTYAGEDPQQESYLQKVGRLQAAKAQAREYVITTELTPPTELWQKDQQQGQQWMSQNEQKLQRILKEHDQKEIEAFFEVDEASQALMSEEEKELAQYNYQQYLMSQYFPAPHLSNQPTSGHSASLPQHDTKPILTRSPPYGHSKQNKGQLLMTKRKSWLPILVGVPLV